MYIWRVDKLIDDFRNNNVSENEKFRYFLFFSFLSSLYIFHSEHLYKDDFFQLIDRFLTIFITFFGTYYCYLINNQGDGKDFIVRIICFSLPVLVKVSVFYIPIFFLLGFFHVINCLAIEPRDICIKNYENSIFDIIVDQSYSLISYIYIANSIKRIGRVST